MACSSSSLVCRGPVVYRPSPISPPAMARGHWVVLGTSLRIYASAEDERLGRAPCREAELIGTSPWDGKGRVHMYDNAFMVVTHLGTMLYASAPSAEAMQVWLATIRNGLESSFANPGVSHLKPSKAVFSKPEPAASLVCIKSGSVFGVTSSRATCVSCGGSFMPQFCNYAIPLLHLGDEAASQVCVDCCHAQHVLNTFKMVNYIHLMRKHNDTSDLRISEAAVSGVVQVERLRSKRMDMAASLFQSGDITPEEFRALVQVDRLHASEQREKLRAQVRQGIEQLGNDMLMLVKLLFGMITTGEFDAFHLVVERLSEIAEADIDLVAMFWQHLTHLVCVMASEYEDSAWYKFECITTFMLAVCARHTQLALQFSWGLLACREDIAKSKPTSSTDFVLDHRDNMLVRLLLETELVATGKCRSLRGALTGPFGGIIVPSFHQRVLLRHHLVLSMCQRGLHFPTLVHNSWIAAIRVTPDVARPVSQEEAVNKAAFSGKRDTVDDDGEDDDDDDVVRTSGTPGENEHIVSLEQEEERERERGRQREQGIEADANAAASTVEGEAKGGVATGVGDHSSTEGKGGNGRAGEGDADSAGKRESAEAGKAADAAPGAKANANADAVDGGDDGFDADVARPPPLLEPKRPSTIVSASGDSHEEAGDLESQLDYSAIALCGNAFTQQIKFVRALTDMAEQLRHVQPKKRREVLDECVVRLLTHAAALPDDTKLGYLPTSSVTEEMMPVINIVLDECHVFRTKERAPTLLVLELECPRGQNTDTEDSSPLIIPERMGAKARLALAPTSTDAATAAETTTTTSTNNNNSNNNNNSDNAPAPPLPPAVANATMTATNTATTAENSTLPVAVPAVPAAASMHRGQAASGSQIEEGASPSSPANSNTVVGADAAAASRPQRSPSEGSMDDPDWSGSRRGNRRRWSGGPEVTAEDVKAQLLAADEGKRRLREDALDRSIPEDEQMDILAQVVPMPPEESTDSTNAAGAAHDAASVDGSSPFPTVGAVESVVAAIPVPEPRPSPDPLVADAAAPAPSPPATPQEAAAAVLPTARARSIGVLGQKVTGAATAIDETASESALHQSSAKAEVGVGKDTGTDADANADGPTELPRPRSACDFDELRRDRSYAASRGHVPQHSTVEEMNELLSPALTPEPKELQDEEQKGSTGVGDGAEDDRNTENNSPDTVENLVSTDALREAAEAWTGRGKATATEVDGEGKEEQETEPVPLQSGAMATTARTSTHATGAAVTTTVAGSAPNSPRASTASASTSAQDEAAQAVRVMEKAQSLLMRGVITREEYQELVQKDNAFRQTQEEEAKQDVQFWLSAAFGERWKKKRQRLASESRYLEHIPLDRTWGLGSIIVKSNDDLRQEVFCGHLIRLCAEVFQDAGLALRLRRYAILSTGGSTGVLETVTDALSLDALKKGDGFTTLKDHFEKTYSANQQQLEEAKRAFMLSLAGYSLACYAFSIKDRHNGNILLDREGHIIHIDFGFIFGIAPGGSFSLETAPFKLTKEMVDVMGGVSSDLFQEFRVLFAHGFLALRNQLDSIVADVEIMCRDSPFPSFVGKDADKVVDRLRKRFRPELTSTEAVQFAVQLISDSYDAYGMRQYDYFQWMTLGISM